MWLGRLNGAGSKRLLIHREEKKGKIKIRAFAVNFLIFKVMHEKLTYLSDL